VPNPKPQSLNLKTLERETELAQHHPLKKTSPLVSLLLFFFVTLEPRIE